MASQITQSLTPPTDHPDRTDRENFSTDMAAFFSWEATHAGELTPWTDQANALAAEATEDADRAETAAAAAEAHVTAELWSYGSTYNFPQIVVGADGQAYRSLTNDNDSVCPHQYNRVTRVGAANHFISRIVATGDPSGKTYTLKAKMWRETLSGDISLVIEEGSGDFEIMVYDHKVVTQTIVEYSTTATFPAGSDTDVRVRINPDDNDGPDGDLFGVYAVFLYDADDPGTNLLTGDSSWQTDLTGWSPTNCTITLVPAPVNTWAHIQALPDQSGSAGKALYTNAERPYWGAGALFESYAVLADVKASGVQPGVATSGAWRIRDLNTKMVDPDGIVSLEDNEFTLQPGTYFMEWDAPARAGSGSVLNHQSRLFNVTDDVMVRPGTAPTEYFGDAVSHGVARVTIAEAKAFRIESIVDEGFVSWGYRASFNVDQMYTYIKIWKEREEG